MNSFRLSIRLIRRIPNVLSLLLLILVAGVAEGIGISALVPMISSLTGNSTEEDVPVPFNMLPDGLTAVGIEPTFSTMLIFVLLIMLMSFLLIHLQERAVSSARFRFLSELRNHAGRAIFAARWEHLATLSSGDVANQLINESDRGTEALIAMITMFAIIVQLLVYGVFAFLLSWKMFLVALSAVVLASFAALRLIRAVRILGKRSSDINTLYTRQLVDFMRGIRLLKVTNTEQLAEKKLQSSNSIACDTMRRITVSQSLMRFELQALISTAMVIILYISVVVLEIPVSILMVFLFIIMRLMPKFSTLQGQYHNYSAYKPALGAVDQLISDSEAMAEKHSSNGKSFNGLKNSICLNAVSYRYPQAKNNTITDLSLTIKAKSFVAIVGQSGGGKSTLLDLIMGLISPAHGKLLIDGVEISKIDLQTYRKRIGFVSQDSIFFTGTIRENLCLDGECDRHLIWDSLAIAQIDDFVRNLPDGLDAEVGEAGVKLSGGQRQRLSIARALIRRPDILVLDEATSALDSESETRFQKAIEEVSNKYTLILVAHRLSTVRKANHIYVLKDGHLIQNGDYTSLSKDDGVFKQLIHAQLVDEN
jgi:ABC-type multidrug transport system fused ATPase/permease subunit